MIFLYIGVILLVLLVVITILGLRAKDTLSINESILLNTDRQTIFIEVAAFENFVTWNPWTTKDPAIQQTFEGEPMSVGSKYIWSGSRKVGSGSMEITHIEANERVDMLLRFGHQDNPAKTWFALTDEGKQVKLTWSFEMELGKNPLWRFFAQIMKGLIKKDYVKGLNNLKLKLSR